MKKFFLLAIVLMAAGMSTKVSAQKIKIKTGIEVLKEQKFKALEGKRVGLLTNPTGVDNGMKSTIDILHEAPNVNLVALFAPEHGVRGDLHAGDDVHDEKDPFTGVTIYSLHGKTKFPTPEMLENIDVLVYDIQDIGCRSYTYISTMGLAMEACGRAGKEFVVLDRPNPIDGLKVEGGQLDTSTPKFISLVSQYNVPYLYGLTCGELALLFNGEKMIKEQCKLHVVTMKGWKRSMNYFETGLQWILPSPHIPQIASSIFYPVSGILGELGYISIGVGYTLPFEIFAAEWMKAPAMAEALNALNLPGVKFRPIYVKPFYSNNVGKNIQGVQVHLTNYEKARLSEIQFYVMEVAAKLYPEHKVFDHADKERFNMFDKVSGTDKIRLKFSENYKFDDIKDMWNDGVTQFKDTSKKYYLYK